MRKSVFIILLASLFLVASCSHSAWSGPQKKELVKRCKAEGGSSAYCNCYLENAMKLYPNPEDMNEIDFESAVELSLNCP